MNNPLKIIYKYKNNNNRIQYFIYILIGSMIPDKILDILNSIKNKNFFDTLMFLSKKHFDSLIEYYGKNWYNFFFTTEHLKYSFNKIINTTSKKRSIINKFGDIWYKININKNVTSKRTYSFANKYYDYMVERKKIKNIINVQNNNFTTYSQTGGTVITDQNIDNKIDEENEDNVDTINNIEDLEDEVIEEFDIDELTELYSMEQVNKDKEIQKTSKLISEAINDKSWEKKITDLSLKFSKKKEEINFDENLSDVYEKIYITDQYIFFDDTINIIKKKLATVIPISEKFGDNIKLLPEYQYLWINYNLNNTNDNIMLGQKWIRRNELLKIDIEPNNSLKAYENLSNNLGYLRDSFGIKIKREDDEHKILSDYQEYISNNEIYMIDILNELGLNYNSESEKKKNLFEVYINIYFPFVSLNRFNSIINLLNKTNQTEIEKNNLIYKDISNDVKLEKEIYELVELNKKNKNNLFYNNYVIQTIIHVNIKNDKNISGTVSKDKINLFKIFDNFVVSKEYPFIQYQTPDAQLTYKFFTKTERIDNKDILNKWFENAPYGISFKIRVNENKYMSINLHENNRIEYKVTWKEDDKATVDDIKKSYQYIYNLLLKINSENKKVQLILPNEDKFTFAFINTILKFELPNKSKINHNDLSDFSRYFFPYISLVIEPKKRQSQKSLEESASKYGTYLRYKRVSDFENVMRMHLRILYLLRNFDISDKNLILEVGKQFNITDQLAAEQIDIVRNKYGKSIKSNKVLRKYKKLPKGKPPGIGIDIQGRTSDNYKIRITGAKSKEQLDDIVSFMRVLIFLYYETYVLKKGKNKKILEKLKKLNKIAQRRNKVNEIVNYEDNVNNVKEITSLDKKRLGFRPNEGQNQWTRSCQNSGTDKKRRPIILSSSNVKELLKRGYKMNNKTGYYEKKVNTKIKGKKYDTIVRAVKLYNDNNTFNFYTCDPTDNNEHMYIGFLSKSNNPNDLCMPCCFKKDQLESDNKIKKNYYLKCLGKAENDNKIEETNKELTDKLYILQETNKVQEGRFLYLSKSLNYLFNDLYNHDKIIHNHYLTETNSGYFFKFTVKDNTFNFLAAMSNIFDLSIDDIKKKLINILQNDNKENIFTYLNNGDIKTSFNTRDNFIRYIKNSTYLEYDILGEFVELPGVFTKNGITFYIFKKNKKIIKRDFEKDKVKDFFTIKCLNYENKNNILEDRDIIYLINDTKYYFPIYKVLKRKKIDKNIILKKIFNKNENNVLIENIQEFYSLNCLNKFLINLNIMREYSCKFIVKELESKNINIKYQIIDKRNKCRYLELDNGLYFPVTPSGTSLNYPIKDISLLKNIKDLNYCLKELKIINKKLFENNNYIPITIYYSSFQNNNYFVTSILLKNNLIMPIKSQYMTAVQFKKYTLNYEFQTKEELVDNEIINKTEYLDNSKLRVNTRLHKNEGYNLYRLELSNYLSKNSNLKKSIINIVKSKNISINEKKKELKTILTDILKIKIKSNQFINTFEKKININKFDIKNIRNTCNINRTKDKCNAETFCNWNDKICVFSIKELYVLEYIKRVIEEFIIAGIKYKEILKIDNYYVSDIVNYQVYSNRPDQKIIKTTNFNVTKIMEELFGKNRTPTLGKRYIKINTLEEEDLPKLEIIGDMLSQEIISNDNSVIRAYVNSYFWLNNKLYDNESRNLGFISDLQTELTNLFKANIIDYLQNNTENIELQKDLNDFFNNSNVFFESIKKFRNTIQNTDGKLELIILSYIFRYPIIVYNDFNEIINIYSNGIVKVNDKTIKKYLTSKKDSINIKFYFESQNEIPLKIYSIYFT